MLWSIGCIADIQLDVVGFLGILGEDAMKKTSCLASLSHRSSSSHDCCLLRTHSSTPSGQRNSVFFEPV